MLSLYRGLKTKVTIEFKDHHIRFSMPLSALTITSMIFATWNKILTLVSDVYVIIK